MPSMLIYSATFAWKSNLDQVHTLYKEGTTSKQCNWMCYMCSIKKICRFPSKQHGSTYLRIYEEVNKKSAFLYNYPFSWLGTELLVNADFMTLSASDAKPVVLEVPRNHAKECSPKKWMRNRTLRWVVCKEAALEIQEEEENIGWTKSLLSIIYY